MFELAGASTAQRLTLAVTLGLWLALAWWLLLGGPERVGGWMGAPGNHVRRICLAAALLIYYVRILFTEFVFLRRGVSWREVLAISPWLLLIFLWLAVTAAKNHAPLGPAGFSGIVLFLAGSWMNSYGEYSRHVWKRRPENRERLYTMGLFRYSRHPNYLGDLILFSGMCLIAGGWATAVIPALMLAGFVFFNIPALDAHLHDHYGRAFDDYAKRTRKLIPFVY